MDLEERTYHARCHLIIIGSSLLDWVYKNPSLIVGNLFGVVNISSNDSNITTGTCNTIGLLLGVTPKDVKTEHRAALITFPQWHLMYIVEEGNIGNNEQSADSETDISF